MTLPDIARRAGLAANVVRHLLKGTPSKNLAPPRRILASTAERLLAVQAAQPALAGLVDGTGPRRRLQALAFMGYDYRALASGMGTSPQAIRRLIHGDGQVRSRTAQRAARLYDRTWQLPGPSGIAAAAARERGWAGPLAWDDHQIDDPGASPRGMRRLAAA